MLILSDCRHCHGLTTRLQGDAGGVSNSHLFTPFIHKDPSVKKQDRIEKTYTPTYISTV